MNALHIIKTHRRSIGALCQRYGVRRLRMIGSGLRADWDPEHSDFDFVAEFDDPPSGINRFEQQFGLLADLEALLGRPVDVVDWGAAKRPHFRASVESQARVIYAA